MAANKRQRYDWAAVERDYRTGQYSNRELSRLHGPSEAAIRAKAKAQAWQKDLSEKIRQRVKEKTSRAVAREVVQAETDEEIIERAAEAGADIVHGHQKMLRRAKGLTETLMEQLEEQLERGSMRVMNKAGDVVEVDIPLDYAGKTLSNATVAMERVVKLQRQAYGLDVDAGAGTGKSLDELLAEVTPDAEE